MLRLPVVLTLSFSFLFLSSLLAQGQQTTMILSPGEFVVQEPVALLSVDALVYVQLNSMDTLLGDLNDLIISGLPEELLPDDLKPLLSSEYPVLSILGLKTMGLPLQPKMLEQMLGFDLSAKTALALYPMSGGIDFLLYVPVSNHLKASGLLMNIIQPVDVVKVTEAGHTIRMVQVGNRSLPQTLYVYSASQGIFISSSLQRLGRLLSEPAVEQDAFISSEIKQYEKHDLAVVVNTTGLTPLVAKLAGVRSQLNRLLTKKFGAISAKPITDQDIRLDNQLRWRLGINGRQELMAFIKAYFLGSFDTAVHKLTTLAKQTQGLSVGVDLSGDFQTLTCRLHSDLFKSEAGKKPIDLRVIKQAVEQLQLSTQHLWVTNRQPQNQGPQFHKQWIAYTKSELQKEGLSTRLVDTLGSIWDNQLPQQPIESLSDWTIESAVLYVPIKKPGQFNSLTGYLTSFKSLMNEPFVTRLMVMPQLPKNALEQLLANNALGKNQNIKIYDQKMSEFFNGNTSYFKQQYKVTKRVLPDEINLLTRETSILSTFGLFGFNQHELISRRYLLYKNLGDYTVIHDGASTTTALNKMAKQKPQPFVPVVGSLFDQVPANAQRVEIGRLLPSLPDALKYLGQIELLAHRELDAYLQQVQQVLVTPGLTGVQKMTKVQSISNIPVQFYSLRANTQTKKLYATLPFGFAYPRPRVYPVIRELFGDFPDYVDKEGGSLCWMTESDGQKQIVLKQDTRLLARLIKVLGNQIAKRYLQSPNPEEQLKKDFLVPLDGHQDFEQAFYNPMWDMLYYKPEFERNLWKGTTAKPVDHAMSVYFMDMETGEMVVASSNQLPPIKLQNGHEAVRAFIFSCGDCGDESSRFVGWLETYTPAAIKAIYAPVADPEADMDNYELIENGHLVSDPIRKKWVMINSEAGFKIMDLIPNKCGTEAPRPCFPSR